jgi:hypothetical protein
LNIAFALAATSSVLALVLALQSYHAYRFVRKSYLLNFSAGFLLLAISYAVLLPLALGVKLPGNFQDTDDILNYPVFSVMETVGYALIALAYSQTKKSRTMLFGLISFVIALVILVLLPSSFVPLYVDVILYLVNTSLVAYVLFHMLKIMPPTDLVFVGFLLLGIHEYTQFITQVAELIYNYPDDGYFLISEIIRISALAFLCASFLVIRFRKPVPMGIMERQESA